LTDSDRKLSIGGYGQIDYNKALNSGVLQNGNLDVHRLVMLFGYKFSKNANFVTEIEFEHVSEVFVEQAFINYRINKYINFRGGLLLIPMGIVNEYHEPPVFNGVERPNTDKYIVPSTWREIGAGISGNFNELGLKYQLYIVNGFNSFDGEATLSGSSGLRGGRQKGAESFMSFPGFSGKVDYYAIRGLQIGLAGYAGKSNSLLYDGINRTSTDDVSSADSSVVGITMFGADMRYSFKGIQVKGQFILTNVSNTDQYNDFSGSDLGSGLFGLYGELSYNIFRLLKVESELLPFIRYENYDTHYKVSGNLIKNEAFNREEIIFGLGWKPAKGLIFKADFQKSRNKTDRIWENRLNLGVGVMF